MRDSKGEFQFLDFDRRNHTPGAATPSKNASSGDSGGREYKSRAIDSEPEYDGSMTMLAFSIAGAALVGLALLAGYIGLWVLR
jgi:hypothetical protein